MLSVHKRCNTASLLNLGNRMERQRGFTRTFRAIDLDYATFGVPTTEG